MKRFLLAVTVVLASALGSACREPEPPETTPAVAQALPPASADDCEVPEAPALRLLPSRGDPRLEIDRVFVSERGCRMVASGRAGTLWWEDAWAESEPDELQGRVTGLSADGSVLVGRSRALDGSSMAWWRSDGRGRSYLGRLSAQEGAEAHAVSADGLVAVGLSGTSAFRWTASSGMVALPSPAPGVSTEAVATSADGSVTAGQGRDKHGTLEALRWTGTDAAPLGDLPGGIFASQATAISADGAVIVGVSDGVTGRSAFRWTAKSGMQALPCPDDRPAGDCGFRPLAVASDATLVAGCIGAPSKREAVVWSQARGTVRVEELLETQGGLDLEGWTLSCATDVSASGLVLAGHGRDAAGKSGAWLVRLR